MDSPIARVAPWVALLTLLVAAGVGIMVATGQGADASSVGGDFPSFYGAGSTVLNGAGGQLYDPAVQQAAQSEQFADGRFLYFAYPPFTAVAYAGLAWLPYEVAFVLHTVLAVGALIGAVVAFRPFARGMLNGPSRLGIASAVCVSLYPVLRSVLGGQNATFSLLFLVLVARFDLEDHAMGTGLAAAAMLYKPQFGILVILALVIGRRWKATAWAGAGAAVLFGVGVAVAGTGWLGVWVEAVTAFGDENLIVNGWLMVSVLGFVQNLFGTAAWTFVVTGLVLAAVGIPVAVGVVTRRWAEIPWYAVAPLVVLAAPSALYYDTAMVLVTVGVMAAWVGRRRPWFVASVVAVSWTQALATDWSPLFIPVLCLAALLALGSRRLPRGDLQPTPA